MGERDFMSAPAYTPPNLGLARGIQPGYVPPAMKIGYNPDGMSLARDGAIVGEPPEFNVKDAVGNFALGAQGVVGLAGAYNAYKQAGLMEDQLQLQKGMVNRNLANSAKTTNLSLANRTAMSAQMTGNAYGSEGYNDYIKNNAVTVDGSPVG